MRLIEISIINWQRHEYITGEIDAEDLVLLDAGELNITDHRAQSRDYYNQINYTYINDF